jgi:hypothetical protein
MKGLIRFSFPSSATHLTLAVVVILVAATVSCAGKGTIQTTPSGKSLASKLTPFLYYEDGATMFLGVDTRASQYVKEGTIFPLGIALANQSKSQLTFSRENFVLETASGQRFPLVSVEEFNRSYTRSRSDVQLADSAREAMNARFGNYRFVDQTMYPMRGGGGTSTDQFQLGRMFWTHFYVYFPMPEDGIHGQQFTLLLEVPEADDTFVVNFALK